MWINVDFHPHICASSCNRMAITSYNPCSLWECSFIAWWPLDTLLLQQSLACLVPGSTSTPRSSSTGTVLRWWPFFLRISFSPLQVMKEIQDTVEPPEEGVTMEVRNNRRWNLKRNPFQGSSGAGVEEHHGGRGRREKETEQNSNHQEPTQIRYNFCSETKAGLYIVKYLHHNISSQSKYGERKATVRRRTMRKKEEGGLSAQPIQEDDEASHSSNEPFAVRRTKSQKDPHGLEDRDVWFVIFFLPKNTTSWKLDGIENFCCWSSQRLTGVFVQLDLICHWLISLLLNEALHYTGAQGESLYRLEGLQSWEYFSLSGQLCGQCDRRTL